MSEQEKLIKTVRTGEVIKKSEDLSQINALLHRIQTTCAPNQPTTTGNGGTPSTTQGARTEPERYP